MIEQSPVVSGPQNIGTGYGTPLSLGFNSYGVRDSSELITALGVSNLRYEVADNRADFRDAVSAQSYALTERIHENNKDTLRAEYENRIESKEQTNQIASMLKDGFYNLESRLESRFGAMENATLRSQMDELHRKVSSMENAAAVAAAIKQAFAEAD